MSEIDSNFIPPIEKAIQKSVDVAYKTDPGHLPRAVLQRRENLNASAKRTSEFEPSALEKITKIIPEVGKKMASEGLPDDASAYKTQFDLEVARSRVKGFLTSQARMNEQGQAFAWQEIKALDLSDIPVNVVDQAGRIIGHRKYARSSGLTPNSSVLEMNVANGDIEEVPNRPDLIKIGVTFFDRGLITAALAESTVYRQKETTMVSKAALLDLPAGAVLSFKVPTVMVGRIEEQLKKLPTPRPPPGAQPSPANQPAVISRAIEQAAQALPDEALRHTTVELTPDTAPAYDAWQLNPGAESRKSPDHENEDAFLIYVLKNNAGQTVGERIVLIDGSGGALGSKLPEEIRHAWIFDKVNFIKNAFDDVMKKSQNRIDARQLFTIVDKRAFDDKKRNKAFAGVLVVDLYKDQMQAYSKSDCPLVLYRESGFRNRRFKPGWPVIQDAKDLGGPSKAMQVIQPSNIAVVEKFVQGVRMPTMRMDESDGANQVFNFVGESLGGITSVFLKRNFNEPEILMAGTDGVRGSSSLLEPKHSYHQAMAGLFTRLFKSQITPQQTASLMIDVVRYHNPGEDDDATDVLTVLPPSKP